MLVCRNNHKVPFQKVLFNAYPMMTTQMTSSPGEACWWTIHPASKQRSEGEKVRVGDDLILVSVATERYLVNDPSMQHYQADVTFLLLPSAAHYQGE